MQLQLREHGQPGLCHTRHSKRGVFRSLYIHEGQDGLKDTIEKEAAEFGIAASATNLILDKLLKRTTKNMMKEKVESRVFDIIVLRPPAGTFSRARWSNGQGPRPVRSAAFLRCFPTLTKMRRKSADSANAILDWMVEAIAIQKSVGGDFVLDHPEDLVAHPSGDPGIDLEMRHGFCFAGRSRATGRPLPRRLWSILSKTLAYDDIHRHRGDLAGEGPTSLDELWFLLGSSAKNVKSSSKNNRQIIADVQDQANCGVAKHFDFSDGESDAGNTF